MRTSRRSWAFTLVELLIVIMIIMILVGLLVPAVREARESARKARCGTNMAGFGKVLLMYAAKNRGQLPSLAEQGDGYYDRSSRFEQFFAENDVSPELAYSPSRRVPTTRWANYVPTKYDADWNSPGKVIVDNSGDGSPTHVTTQTLVKDDQQGGAVFTTSGIWAEENHAQAENLKGSKLNAALGNGWAKWTFDLGGVSGSGPMQIWVKMRKWPGGHPTVRYKVYGTKAEVNSGTPQATIEQSHYAATESYQWVSLGTFNIDGENAPYITVENDGAGYTTPETITWDGRTDPDSIGSRVDNGTPGRYTEPEGSWTSWNDFSEGAIGGSARYSETSPTTMAQWTITIPAGYSTTATEPMEVFAYIAKASDRSSNARYEVVGRDQDVGNPQIGDMSHNANPAEHGWYRVGAFHFAEGTRTVTVTRHIAESNRRLWADAIALKGTLAKPVNRTTVWADAVKMEGTWTAPFVPSPGYFVTEGTWTRETSGSGKYGADYHQKPRNAGTAKAAWFFRVDQQQEYEVFGQWPAAPSNVSDAKFKVVGAEGAINVTVNQTDTDKNGTWRSLCRTTFAPNALGYVEIDSSGPSGTATTIADAIAVVPVTTTFLEPRPVIGYLYFGYRADDRDGYPSKGIVPGQTILTPSSVQDVSHPGSVPILADLLAPNSSELTTHKDGVHILYLDGRVEWVPAEQTKERWVDSYGNRFRW